MVLNAGSRLGSYEIVAPLGAGGMGEVYRGRDLRLGREVAIKILSPEFAANTDRLQRFEQEARSASALNHPNIITIYEIGVSDSNSFISMEYVEGKTLREVLQAGPLPARKAVQFAAQIAEGLAKAHEAGIVHRDLKPENLMVTSDGYIKILDFGLAKLTAPTATDQVSALPTTAKTGAGILLGTVGYMSPEQASGSPVDFRSDQFSLGVILYEMVTAKRAFQKKTTVETLAAIINEDPEPVQSINSHVAAPIRWLIERCIEKNPADRYASSRDLARDIQSIRDHYSEVASSSEPGIDVPHAIQPRRKFHKVFDVAAVLLILTLISTLFFLTRDQPKVDTKSVSYHRLTYRRGPVPSAQFTSDGQTIVYSAMWEGDKKDLFLSRRGAVESRSMGIFDADVLSISPSGEMLILTRFGGPGVLAQVGLTGGSPRPIENNVISADWTSDGSKYAVSKYVNGKYRLEFPPGKVLYESSMAIDPVCISPKQDRIAFNLHYSGASNGRILIIDFQGNKLADSGDHYPSGLAWAPSGKEAWFTTLSTKTGGGSEMYALDDTGHKRLLSVFSSAVLLDIAVDGSMLMNYTDHRVIAMAKAAGTTNEKSITWLDNSQVNDISPDGTKVLIHERGDGSESPGGTIYMANIDGTAGTRLAGGAAQGFSPDGGFVLGGLQENEVILVPTGPGSIQSYKGEINERVDGRGFFPDGKHFLVTVGKSSNPPELFVMDLSGKKVQLPVQGFAPVGPMNPISSDGESIILQSPDGVFHIYSVPSNKTRILPGIEVNERPMGWSKDGKSIFVRTRFGISAKVHKIEVSTGKRTLFKEFVLPDPAGVIGFPNIVISDDEQAYAYSYTRDFATLYLIENFQ